MKIRVGEVGSHLRSSAQRGMICSRNVGLRIQAPVDVFVEGC